VDADEDHLVGELGVIAQRLRQEDAALLVGVTGLRLADVHGLEQAAILAERALLGLNPHHELVPGARVVRLEAR